MLEPSTTQPATRVQTLHLTVEAGQWRSPILCPAPAWIYTFCSTELAVMRDGVGLPPGSETKALDQEM